MTQDLADQLTAETVKDTVRNRLTANYSYGYDANGNRTSDSAGPYTTNNVNQITNSGYTYDLNGNLLSDGTRTYEWDAANRLVAINQGRQRSEFTYESSGHFARIVEKDRGRITSDTRYVWNGVKLLEMRDTATNAVLARYYDQGAVVTPATNPLRLYATFDHLGSVREVTDASGNLQARYDYDPYGKPTQLAGRIQSNILYAGYFYHAPSGLYFTKSRAYDPSVGRWLSRDPIAERGGLNLYGHVGNNPANLTDPLGLCPGDWWDPRTWFNKGLTDSLGYTWTSLQDVTGDSLNGNWNRLAADAAGNPLGQTENNPTAYTATTVLLGTSFVSASGTVPVAIWNGLSPGAKFAIVNALMRAATGEGDPVPGSPRLPPPPRPPITGGR